MRAAVVADDLTGACATGSLLVRYGRVRVWLSRPGGATPSDILVFPTATRSEASIAVADRVKEAVRAAVALGAPLLAKRIDSTLRGHIGLELGTMMGILGRPAVIVPAMPASGRTTRGGVQYLDGVPVAETEAGLDPGFSSGGSDVRQLLSTQLGRSVAHLPLAVVRAGPAAIEAAVRASREQAVVCDAETDADITALAAGCRALEILPADPGPFTAALVGQRSPVTDTAVSPPGARRVLVLAGSPTGRTRAQVGVLEATLDAPLLSLGVEEAHARGAAEALARRLLCELDGRRVAGVKSAATDLRHRDPGVAGVLGGVAAAVRAQQEVGLVVSGGDVAAEVCARLGAEAVEVTGPVFPLCAVGRLVGGRHPGTALVTKGGMVGDDGAFVACVRALQGGGGCE